MVILTFPRLLIISFIILAYSSSAISQPVVSLSKSTNSTLLVDITNLTKGCRVNFNMSITAVGFTNSKKSLRVYSAITRANSHTISLESDLTSDSGKDLYANVQQKCGNKLSSSLIKRVKIGRNATSNSRSSSQILFDLRSSSIRSNTFLRKFISGDLAFAQPVDIGFIPGKSNQIFVVEQGGKIYKINEQKSKKTLVLDISSLISKGGERGLLGLAFHPQYSRNRFIYVNYTRLSDNATIIARFRTTISDRVIPLSQKRLLKVTQPFRNHNGGGLAFGPDGYLYIALGDGGSANDPQGNGQKLSTMLGKILRIDVNTEKKRYIVPNSNPFFNNTSGYKKEIYAYGLRNPWRISFDDNNLWVADVGQNALEEVNLVKKGGNYGWAIKEGSSCFRATTCNSKGLQNPINEYGRTIGTSVTGGYVSRYANSPNIDGVYIFADFVSGRVFGLERILNRWVRTEIFDTTNFISTFGRDSSGLIYMASYSDGKIYTIR